jgi:LysR family transcriptional activator of nhaA
VVLSDVPVPESVDVKAFNHRLGECGLSFLATRAVRKSLKGTFPENLNGAPMLLPTSRSAIRRSIDAYFLREGIRPHIVAEVADSAMLKVLGSDGLGVFPVPDVIEESAKKQFSVVTVGATDDVREAFYAISTERRVRNPAVLAICTAARTQVFGDDGL